METLFYRSASNASFAEERTAWTISVATVSGTTVDAAAPGNCSSMMMPATPDRWSSVVGAARGLAVVAVAAVGLGLNSFVLFAIVADRKLRGKVMHVLICHLAAVDVLWCVLLLVFETVSGIVGCRWGESVLCLRVYGFCRTVVCHATVWTIASLSWDKYRTIASPMSHSPTARLLPVSVCLGLIWIVGALVGVFPFLFCGDNDAVQRGGESPSNDDSLFHTFNNSTGFTIAPPVGCRWYLSDYGGRGNACRRPSSDQSGLSWYPLFLSIDTFVLPLALLVYCYCHIFRIARWQRKRIAVMTAMVRVITLSVGVPITHENARKTSNQVTTRGRKALRTVCTFLGAFLFCYAADGAASLVGTFYRLDPLPVALADMTLMTSPTVNALIYGLRNRTLKQSFRNCVRRKCAQYAVKFPGLHDVILRHFGSSDKVVVDHFKDDPCGGGESPPLPKPPPPNDANRRIFENEEAEDEEEVRCDTPRRIRTQQQMAKSVKVEPSKSHRKSSTSGDFNLSSGSTKSVGNHYYYRHSENRAESNRRVVISRQSDRTSDEKSRSANGLSVNASEGPSKHESSSEDEEGLARGPAPSGRDHPPPPATATRLVVEGKNRIVVGVDVHAMLRNNNNSL